MLCLKHGWWNSITLQCLQWKYGHLCCAEISLRKVWFLLRNWAECTQDTIVRVHSMYMYIFTLYVELYDGILLLHMASLESSQEQELHSGLLSSPSISVPVTGTSSGNGVMSGSSWPHSSQSFLIHSFQSFSLPCSFTMPQVHENNPMLARKWKNSCTDFKLNLYFARRTFMFPHWVVFSV